MSNESNILNSSSSLPEVWVVILHWQGLNHTIACLQSVMQLHYPTFKVLIVDNGSSEEQFSSASHQVGRASPISIQLAKDFPQAHCLVLSENLGFAGGCNAGIKYCIDHNAQWVWLLNNDTKVTPDSLTLLLSYGIRAPRVAALGATVGNGSGETHATSGPGEIDYLRAKTYLRPQKDYLTSATVSCQWLSGSNLLLRTSALKEAGYFDPDYFLYFEDTELCYRLRQHGFECLFVRDAYIEHIGGASTAGERTYWRAYYYTRNRLLFFMSTANWFFKITALISITAHLLRHLLVLPFRGHTGYKQLKAEYLGLRDYIMHRFGKATCLDWCDISR